MLFHISRRQDDSQNTVDAEFGVLEGLECGITVFFECMC